MQSDVTLSDIAQRLGLAALLYQRLFQGKRE